MEKQVLGFCAAIEHNLLLLYKLIGASPRRNVLNFHSTWLHSIVFLIVQFIMNSRHYAPPLFRYSAIPIPPFRQSTILPFHKSVPISRNYCISPHFKDVDVLVRCKEKHLCTLLVVFGATDLCLLRKPNISYLDSFQMLWINVANLPMLLMMNMMSLPLPKITK